MKDKFDVFRGGCTDCDCPEYTCESSSVICAYCGHYPVKHPASQNPIPDQRNKENSSPAPPNIPDQVNKEIELSGPSSASVDTPDSEVIVIEDQDSLTLKFQKEIKELDLQEQEAEQFHLNVKSKSINCGLCDHNISLGKDHKGFYNLRRHISSNTHKLNLELINPDLEQCRFFELIIQRFPDIIIVTNKQQKGVKCRVCLIEFCVNHKNVFSNINQHVRSQKHTRLKSKRTNTKDISSFFPKKKTSDQPRQPTEL